MFKQLIVLATALLWLTGPVGQAADNGLVAWYRFDEGAGSVATDSSGNGYDATILGDPLWVKRPDGTNMALEFGPAKTEGVECPAFDPTDGTGRFTVAMWALWDGDESYHHFFTKSDRWGTETMMFQLELWGGSASEAHYNRIGVSYDPDSIAFQTMPKEEWTHVAFAYDGAEMAVYMNGIDDIGPKPVDIGPALSARTAIGVADNDIRIWSGILDDVRIYSRPLDASEVIRVMEGDPASARKPKPRHGATDVPLDSKLSWDPGELVTAHDVYLGTDLDDVNDATRDDPRGLLVSQGQSVIAYDPDSLDYGRTYYWRIDEVHGTSNNAIVKGCIWRFTTEPLARPVADVSATASHSQTGQGPENTIDGSGLDDQDAHSTNPLDMWLAIPKSGQDLWIQYDFSRIRKLHEMVLWNHNTSAEPVEGIGLKDVFIEHSVDGQDWTPQGLTQLAQASGLPGASAGTSISFDDVPARYVRLTVQSGWGDTGQYGLAEVRFLAIGVEARTPKPANDAANIDVTTHLNWTKGRGALEHQVYLSTDPEAVASGSALFAVTDQNSCAPQLLDFGSTYYWRIDEVTGQDAETWEGDLWQFTTQEYRAIDDFEHYTDNVNASETVWHSWIDALDDSSNGGAVVGHENSPFAEQTIVHGGRQSMPLTYDNSSAGFSQAYRQWDPPQDWTASGAEILTLHFRGHPVDFRQRKDNSIVIGAAGAGLSNSTEECRFVYKMLSGDGEILARVDRLAPTTNGWAKAGVIIREGLYAGSRYAAVVVTPANGVAIQSRSGSGTTPDDVHQVGLVAPYWVRLTRSGRFLTAARSPDGLNWDPIAGDPTTSTIDLPMTNSVFIGLIVTSASANNPTIGEFSRVATNGVGSWQVKSIGVEMPSNDPEPVYVVVEDNSGHSHRTTYDDPEASGTPAWRSWSLSIGDLIDAGVDMTAVTRMTIGVGDPTDLTASGQGMLYVDDIRIGAPLVKLRSPVAVANHSFEAPGTEEQLNFDDVPGWSTDGAPVGSGVEAGQGPTDGAWSAYLMAGDPALWQLTDEIIQAGDVFELTVDAGAACGNPELVMTLYYDDEGLRRPACAAKTKLTADMTEYAMILETDDWPACVGHRIGMAFETTDCWGNLDNVHLYVHDRPSTAGQ